MKKIKFTIERKIITLKPIIPLGADCHPANILKSLGIRKESYPFDWMNTEHHKCIEYVNENIKNDFNLFLSHLVKNHKNNIVSNNYTYAEFYQFKDLINNEKTQKKIKLRANKFLDIIQKKSCYFLLNVSAKEMKDSKINEFIFSIKEFHRITNYKHDLLIYIRFDDNINENKETVGRVLSELEVLEKTRVVKYLRGLATYGIWGNEKDYIDLLKRLNVKLIRLPRRLVISYKDNDS